MRFKRWTAGILVMMFAVVLAGSMMLGTSAVAQQPPAPADEVFLFAFFKGNSTDGLHLASSEDGMNWKAIANDRSFLRPQVGEQKLMRDPTVLRGPDGTFHMVWTTAWNGQTIGYASSKDLINWSEQRAIPVMSNFPTCQQCWAPEIRYDPANEQYLVYWSSTVRDGTPNYFATYCTTTKDFQTFAPAKLFIDPGFAQIDASILKDGDKFRVFVKHSAQGTRHLIADNLMGPYKDPSENFAYPNRDEWEGAWPTKIGDAYIVYVDHYRSRDRMGIWKSTDLRTWENITDKTTGLRGVQHGSVIKVPRRVVDTLNAAPATAPSTQPG